jgi:uncharacterized delta-60 repeat protein
MDDMEIQPDGRILVSGNFFGYLNGVEYKGIARLLSDGNLDTSFANAGQTQLSPGGQVADIELLPDGKILIIGYFQLTGSSTLYNVLRLNSNGTVDNSFVPVMIDGSSDNGIIKALPDGKIIVVGNFNAVNGVNRQRIARLNVDGSLDTSFNLTFAPFSSTIGVYGVKVRNDGKILIGGAFSAVNGAPQNNIVLINQDGTVDASFSPNVSNIVTAIEETQDGSVLIAGHFATVNGVARNRVAKLLTSGQLDTSFNVDANLELPKYVIKVYPDGRIILGGSGGFSQFVVLNPNGALNTFIPSNSLVLSNSNASDIEIQSGGKVLLSGSFTQINNVVRRGLARLNRIDSLRTTPFDYDGDGRADLSVYRPTNSGWYLSRSANNSFYGTVFGIAEDIITPADFDGDGKTDIAVFRPSAGAWYRFNSSNNQFVAIQFGQSGDIPIPGDFDGDARADISVFRPSNGAWYRLNSSNNQFVGTQWGTTGDLPQIADLDGDGKSDLTVFRPSTGAWYSSLSSNTAFFNVTFGASGDIPTPADYDGDGKTDVSVFRPSAGTWYRTNSSNNAFFGQQFGANGDAPVAADYDGDGKADIGVFRQGNWYIQRSNSGFFGQQFGTGSDIPTPFAFNQ